MNEIVERWIKKVESDLKSARILFESQKPTMDMVCFHSQQAIEKFLKAYLTHLGIKAGRTHDIATLLKLCMEKDKDFKLLDTEKLESLHFMLLK